MLCAIQIKYQTLVMIVFPEKLLVIETTFLPINVTLAERQPLCLIFGPQDVGAYLLRILLPTK